MLVRAARSSPSPYPPEAAAESRAREVARGLIRQLALPDAVSAPIAEHAARLGVTGGHLTESVRRATGRTPGQLLREARTREAKRLLSAGDLTVRQVAGRVGYPDPAYFSRFFRRETGMTPGAFRHAHRADHHLPHAQSIAESTGSS
ncbi:helix-turn-helix transcriptional regulator [Streptomyces sp. 549]|uniref:helix-turn-helix transcriptional regulator n=1 Tax=Streptomyces sp. 549 TaxID=3049076 RepID=UPI0024C3C7FF|nr:helix-turn-helix transcriptional regulator [Streptomyces sp. 549]MDK1474692.1 helix-turn-helix transcriptional regulator [Streptomyces sp. 549]